MAFIKDLFSHRLISIKETLPIMPLLIGSLFISVNGYAQETPGSTIGTLAGDFQVSSLGEAVYNIDIQVPPGTMDIEPALGLMYSNQSPDGPLGLGFNITGISSITRCQATEPLDGFVSAVDYSDNDRFCIDGERLILISDGRYGDAGTIYHTEHETWLKVEARGVCGSGPCAFVAYNKDGWQMEYGTVDNAKLFVPGRPEVISWQIYRTVDLNGNYAQISYQSEADQLQNLPIEIAYTGNLNTDLKPQRKVSFEYHDKPREVPKYMGGSRFVSDQRIAFIRTSVSGQQVLEYRFSYTESSNSQRSLLSSIQLCSAISQTCMAPTEFNWEQADNSIGSPNADPQGRLVDGWCMGAEAMAGSGDFNGDGLIDLLCINNSQALTLVSTGSEVQSPNNRADGELSLPTAWCTEENAKSNWADFNGDQKIDLLCADDASSFKVLASDGRDLFSLNNRADGELSVPVNWCPVEQGCNATWTNFDGDGRVDLACNCSSGEQRVLLSTGTDVESPNSSATGTVATGFCTTEYAQVFWSDYNGDGQSDLFCREQGRQSVLVSDNGELVSPNNSADGFLIDGWCTDQYATLLSTDFNGDRLDDLACHSTNGLQQVLLSTGTGLASPNNDAVGTIRSNWCNSEGRVISWADFNSDGLSDMFCHETSGRQSVLVSDGRTVSSPIADANGLVRTDWCPGGEISGARTTDFNGDALADLSCHLPDQGQNLSLVHAQPYPDQVVRISNGIGSDINIEYEPLTGADIYSAGDAVEYPLLDVRSAKYLVSSYGTTDGRGAEYRYSYHYTGARTDMERRDWLGFSSIKRVREADNTYTITRYSQEYPVIKYTASYEEFDANGSILKRAEFTPVVSNPYPNVYQVKNFREIDSTFTNNQPDYIAEKQYEYDQYGNPQLISNLGDIHTDSDDVFDCWHYQNNTGMWRLGYQLAHKTTSSAAACRAFIDDAATGWSADTDLRWDRTAYDSQQNATVLSAWDNQNDIWLDQQRSYDAYGNVISATGWNERTTTVTYDDKFHAFATEVLSPRIGSDAGLLVTNRIEPAFGRMIEETDANGNVKANVFDGFGRLLEQWGPYPDSEDGAPVVRLKVTEYGSDGFGQYVETRERLTWEEDDPAQWPWKRMYFDGLSRPIRTMRSAPVGGEISVTEQRYNAEQLPSQVSIPHFINTAPDWAYTYYDTQDREIRNVQPDGTVNTFDYLRGVLEIRETMAAGSPEQRQVLKQASVRETLISSTGQNNGEVRYQYDRLLQTTEVVGANQDKTTNTYDSFGRLVSTTSSDTGRQVMQYNKAGQLLSLTDANGNVSTFDYDGLDRLVLREVQSAEGEVLRYQYYYDEPQYRNGQGNLTRVVGPYSTHEFSYTNYGLVATERVTIDGRQFVQQIEYDPLENTTRLTYPDGAVLATTYDLAGNIHTQSLAEGQNTPFENIVTYSAYSALGQVEQVEYGNGIRGDYQYYTNTQSMARLKSLEYESEHSHLLYGSDYQWNRVGQVTDRNIQHAGETAAQYRYSYNNMGWLTQSSGPEGIFDYAYDIAGNIITKDNVDYRYHPNTNKLATGSNNLEVTHDNYGNVTELQNPDGRWSLHYNQENHLVGVRVDDRLVNQVDYDFNGSRLQRVDEYGNQSLYISSDYDVLITAEQELHTKYINGPGGRVAAITTTYQTETRGTDFNSVNLRIGSLLFDTGHNSGRWQHYRHLLSAGWTRLTANPAWVALLLSVLMMMFALAWWRLKSRGSGIGQQQSAQVILAGLLGWMLIISQSNTPVYAQLQPGNGYPSPGMLYFHGDVVESNVLVTNQNGHISSVVSYFPYGEVDQQRSHGPDNFRPKFNDKEFDSGTELYYFDARYLHPALGRFVQPDPELQFSSPYTYVGNDPLSMMDSEGEAASGAVIAIMAVVGAIVGAYAGGVGANNSFNPAHWDWQSSKTLGHVFAGAAIGAVGGALFGVAAGASTAVGFIGGATLIGAAEGFSFALLGGGSPKDLAVSAILGGASAGLLSGAGIAVSSLTTQGSRMAHRGATMTLSTSNTSINRAGVNASSVTVSQLAGKQGALTSKAIHTAHAASVSTRHLSPSLAMKSACFSFTEDVQISTGNGLRPITEVNPGDQVWGMHDEQGKALFTVLSSYRRLSQHRLILTMNNGEEIETTVEHPFWVVDKGWTIAGELDVDDWLLSASDQAISIVDIQSVDEPKMVYNFEVAQSHNYLISELQLLTHNGGGRCGAISSSLYNKLVKQKMKPRHIMFGKKMPSLHDNVGQQVLSRMVKEGTAKEINGKMHIYVQTSLKGKGNWKWLPFTDNMSMGHIEDPVLYWNRIGHKFGARSKEVTNWMFDPNNYVIEYAPFNKAKGLSLQEQYVKPWFHMKNVNK